jgi:FixJ family two-component response regulator
MSAPDITRLLREVDENRPVAMDRLMAAVYGDLRRVAERHLGERFGPGLPAALDRLEALDARKADVVKLRALWGLQMREVARSLGVSLATVEHDWAFAKAWLAREAAGGGPDAG